jgi:hypothetical protein
MQFSTWVFLLEIFIQCNKDKTLTCGCNSCSNLFFWINIVVATNSMKIWKSKSRFMIPRDIGCSMSIAWIPKSKIAPAQTLQLKLIKVYRRYFFKITVIFIRWEKKNYMYIDRKIYRIISLYNRIEITIWALRSKWKKAHKKSNLDYL